MNSLMTIQEFSIITGVSKSALRYYETIGLLRSEVRSDGNYRLYSKDQIDTIKLISSLRLADVSIKEIQEYLKETDEVKKSEMMQRWSSQIQQRIDLLAIGKRYLESDSLTRQIYLLQKPAETIVWFEAQAPVGMFHDAFMKLFAEINQHKIDIKSTYLKYISGDGLVIAHLGFGVSNKANLTKLVNIAAIEHMPSCMCITLPFDGPLKRIVEGHQKLMEYASAKGWFAINSIMEWYQGKDYTDLSLIMPVAKIGMK